jgi:hypothetical protein
MWAVFKSPLFCWLRTAFPMDCDSPQYSDCWFAKSLNESPTIIDQLYKTYPHRRVTTSIINDYHQPIPIKSPVVGAEPPVWAIGRAPADANHHFSAFLKMGITDQMRTKGLRDEKWGVWGIRWSQWIRNTHVHLCFVRKRTEAFGLGMPWIGRGCRFRTVEEPFGALSS